LKAFVDALAFHARVRNRELLEKDILLHSILGILMEDPVLRRDLLLKGGTCLCKCYLDYYRFSEDLDFTWKAPAPWFGMGSKELRRVVKKPRERITAKVRRISETRGLRLEREGGEDIEFGRSGQMVGYRLRYESEVTGTESSVRIQVNMLDPMLFPSRAVAASSLISGKTPEPLRFLDAERTAEYERRIELKAYAPEEILAEKARAVLTRQAAKIRDVVDLYFLEKSLGLRVADFADAIARKTMFMVARHARYRREFERASDRFEALVGEDPSKIMLRPLDEGEFSSFRTELLAELDEQRKRIADAPASGG